MPNFLFPIALILSSVAIVFFRNRLKAVFNSRTGFKTKMYVFGTFVMAPFMFIFGSFELYSKVMFSLNYEMYAPQCLAEYEGDAVEVLSIEYESSAVFVKFRNTGNSDTFWCENKDGEIRFFK